VVFAGHAAHDYFASWKKGPSDPKTVAWELEAIVQFTASINNYVDSQEDTPERSFIHSFAPAQQIQNALMLTIAGDNNGIEQLKELPYTDKGNTALYGNM
jgi:hypothetical protein